MSYRIMQEGRDTMHERGGDATKMKKYIDGIYSMLEEMEECLEEMDTSFGERDDMGMYDREPMRERRSSRTGRYMR